MNAWPTIALGEVLRRSERIVRLDPEATYKEVTVRINGKGVVERRQVQGIEIAANRRYEAKSGQFIISRIDARHGASGLIPDELDGAIVTNDFPLFDVTEDLDAAFLGWMSKTTSFIDLCKRASEGTTNRVRLSEDSFKALNIPLPSLNEQYRIVAVLDALAEKLQRVEANLDVIERDAEHLLALRFRDAATGAPLLPMAKVAPVVRRRISIDPDATYSELGVRSFYKGTFRRRTVAGAEFSWQDLHRINSGDLVFSNIMAWEQAIAIAKPEDEGCVGNHRMLTCEVRPDCAVPVFLWYYFTTSDGFDKIYAASPGTSARNRTMTVPSLMAIEVPVPSLPTQRSFDRLYAKVAALRTRHTSIRAVNKALLPATLERLLSW